MTDLVMEQRPYSFWGIFAARDLWWILLNLGDYKFCIYTEKDVLFSTKCGHIFNALGTCRKIESIIQWNSQICGTEMEDFYA